VLGVQSTLLASVPGVSHRFFQRIGGTSPNPWRSLNTSHDVGDVIARVDENLARVRFQIGVVKDSLYSCTQVHGREVVVVNGANDDVDEVRARKADALVTTAKDIAVAVRTADCVPILLAVDDGSGVAAIHAGWRGAVGGVIEAAVRELCRNASAATYRNITPASIVAAIGPCIGPSAFEVGPDVVDAARVALERNVAGRAAHPTHEALGASSRDARSRIVPLLQPGSADRSFLDLAGLCRDILRDCGVERVDVVAGCTLTEEERYFSHRRDVTLRKGTETGRQMSAIARTAPPNLDDESLR
jgi:YfiH family protein